MSNLRVESQNIQFPSTSVSKQTSLSQLFHGCFLSCRALSVRIFVSWRCVLVHIVASCRYVSVLVFSCQPCHETEPKPTRTDTKTERTKYEPKETLISRNTERSVFRLIRVSLCSCLIRSVSVSFRVLEWSRTRA